MKTSEQWTSKLGFILAAAGSAIGLGAIWKFPYVVGTYGGGAFFLLFVFYGSHWTSPFAGRVCNWAFLREGSHLCLYINSSRQLLAVGRKNRDCYLFYFTFFL
ncbi:hypothetical protein P7H21_18510 [Paenibacillus larvae]|nr:hypothetical protein [Paenibacillus larvae]